MSIFGPSPRKIEDFTKLFGIKVLIVGTLGGDSAFSPRGQWETGSPFVGDRSHGSLGHCRWCILASHLAAQDGMELVWI